MRSTENIKTKLIETTAWLGKDCQTEYKTTIYLGSKALGKYALGAELANCIPDLNARDWITIDNATKTLTLYLK